MTSVEQLRIRQLEALVEAQRAGARETEELLGSLQMKIERCQFQGRRLESLANRLEKLPTLAHHELFAEITTQALELIELEGRILAVREHCKAHEHVFSQDILTILDES